MNTRHGPHFSNGAQMPGGSQSEPLMRIIQKTLPSVM